MYWLAMKMLFHEKLRLLITLVGITVLRCWRWWKWPSIWA